MQAPDRFLPRRLCIHDSIIPAQARKRRKMASGKTRTSSIPTLCHRTDTTSPQTHEVIGSPPNISVPTHFAKVVLTSRPSSPSNPNVHEISTGAFVLPNAAIPDTTPFESFSVPSKFHLRISTMIMETQTSFGTVDAVERAAGLTLFSEQVKASSKHICKSTKCDVTIRRFDDAQKLSRPPNNRSISAPN